MPTLPDWPSVTSSKHVPGFEHVESSLRSRNSKLSPKIDVEEQVTGGFWDPGNPQMWQLEVHMVSSSNTGEVPKRGYPPHCCPLHSSPSLLMNLVLSSPFSCATGLLEC